MSACPAQRNRIIPKFFEKRDSVPQTADKVKSAVFLYIKKALSVRRMLIGTPGAIRTRDLPLRRRTLYPAELRVHYLTGVIVALQTEVVKSKTVEAQIYPDDVSPMINTSTVKPFKYLFTTVI